MEKREKDQVPEKFDGKEIDEALTRMAARRRRLAKRLREIAQEKRGY